MIVRPMNRASVVNLTHDILNNIKKWNVLDFWQVHSIQLQIEQKPHECLQQLIEVLQELQRHKL